VLKALEAILAELQAIRSVLERQVEIEEDRNRVKDFNG